MKFKWSFLFLCHTLLSAATDAFSPTYLKNFYDEFLSEQKKVLSSATVTPPPIAGYVPIQVTNNSGLSDTQLFIFIVANNNNNILTFSPNADGLMVGTLATPPPKTYVNQPGSGTYALNKFAFQSGYVFYIPTNVNLTSSRIYYSVGQPLDWLIPSSGPVSVPPRDFADPTQDGYYILYDKQEFTMVAGNRFVMNPTLVDYYGLPLSFQIGYTDYTQPSHPQVVQYAGLPPTLSSTTIFNNYLTAVNTLPTTPGVGMQSVWKKLYFTYAPPSGSQGLLRVLSPYQGVQSSFFPLDYFLTNSYSTTNWLPQVWNDGSSTAFYQKPANKLYLDLSTAGPSYGVASGLIDGSGNFKFTVLTGTGTGLTMTLPQPTSSRAFFTSTLSDYTPPFISSGNETIDTAIWQGVSAGVISGLLPVPSTSQASPFSQQYARTHTLFANNSQLTSGPWYDFYSGTFIGMGSGNYTKFYTTPYADYLGTDGTVTVTNITQAGAAVIVNIGDMTGIPVPNPFNDNNHYTVQFGILPSDAVVTFGPNPDFSMNPTVSNNQPFPNTPGGSMYMGITYKTGSYAGQIWGTHIIPSAPALKPVLPGTCNLSLTGGPGGTLNIVPGGSPP